MASDDRQLNLIEQLNQTWTYLVTLGAALYFLFVRHSDVGGFSLNLGTAAGTDIESVAPNQVVAEAFAVVHPSNNRKLAKDQQKTCAGLSGGCSTIRLLRCSRIQARTAAQT